MRSKTFMSKINLQCGKLTVENRKSREKKTDMLRSIGKQSGESVESVQEKTRLLSRLLSCDFVCVILCLAVLTQADRQTDTLR